MPRTPSKDFLAALEEAEAAVFFSGCTKSHQNEYLKWIGEARRPETRRKRIEQAVKQIALKQTTDLKRTLRK